MVYCRNCGKEIAEGSVFCEFCGERQKAEEKVSDNDSGSPWWAVLGFFIPIVGFILWLLWRDTKPKSARSAGIGALIGFVLSLPSYLYWY